MDITRELPLDQVLLGDCIPMMEMLPPASVHCVFADPPYNLQLRGELRRPDDSVVDGVDEEWDRFTDFAAYDAFTREWLSECRRVLRKDGTIWVIGAYHNIFRIGAILQDLGFWILNDVIGAVEPDAELPRPAVHQCARDADLGGPRAGQPVSLQLPGDEIAQRRPQMRSDWTLPLCTGPERLRNQHGLKLHPTQKPEALLHRILLASTSPGDIVLDPFLGTGTTAAVAKRLHRHFIGIERHPAYVEAAWGRIRRVRPAPAKWAAGSPTKRDAPRVPFGSLVERGLVPVGTVVMDKQRRVRAVVAADGSLTAGSVRGSIHQVGARLQNAPSCNGWTFWHIERGGACCRST